MTTTHDLTLARRRIADQLAEAIRQGDDQAAEKLLYTWDTLPADDAPQPEPQERAQ